MFLLEVNPLVLPDIGLVFWNTIAFLVLLIVLGKFAWKPMLKAISERESGIEEALLRADKMKAGNSLPKEAPISADKMFEVLVDWSL